MPRPIFAIYSFILLFLVQIGENVEYLPLGNCQEAQEWQLNGRELVRDYKGRVLLLTFISLKKCNPACELTFSKLDSLHDHLSSIRVLAISPKNESPPSELRTFAWRFPRIRFERENEISPIWSWFNATHLDQFIFDRCSRHSSKLPASNQTSPPSYSSTLQSLKTALSAQPCGLCEYDPAKPLPKWPSLHPPIPMKIKNEDVQIGKTPPKTPMIMVNSGLMTSFSLEIGSPKDRIGAPKQLAFAEQRAVGSNHNSRQRDKSSKYQQRLPYGGREQNQQPLSVAVHSYPPQQQQPQSPPQPYPRPQNNPQQHLNSQPQMTQQQLQRQREELARIQQQQMERERLLREHEERLRQRQLMEEQQRRYWAEQQERQRQIQQQHFATSPTAPPPLHPQHQQNEPIQQNQQPPQQKMRQIQQPAPVHYANDPYGDRYRFGLGRANNNNQRIGPNQQQRAHQQQQRPIPMQAAGPADQSAMRSVTPQNPPTNVGFQSPQIMTPSVEPAPLYPEGSENDYYGYDDEWTTEMPSMMQIPRPTKQTAPTTPSIQQDKNFGFELPCTGFSDESCFQQQTQLRPNEVHRCCRGRILFTDQCIHGKCSNMTTQLCCIQRFLQAKLTCCSDERQAETGIGDHFSRCCFDNFVDSDDPCCPREYASEQWRSVHELCLPNVEMDLSAVKVPVPLFGTSLITEFDFSKTDKWRFECRYGGHVQQYSFFEKSASEEDESEGGGEID